MGWANRLATTTAHTGIEVEALLPRQIVEGGDTQLGLIFFDFGIEIGNHRQRPFRTGTFEKGIEGRVDQMAQARIGNGCDERQRHNGVGKPQPNVQPQPDATAVAQTDGIHDNR